MSYVIAILLLLVLPLLIPVTVSVIHGVPSWRRHLRTFAAKIYPAMRLAGPRRLGRQLSASLAGNSDRTGRELGWHLAE
jgi:hypothetical protein